MDNSKLPNGMRSPACRRVTALVGLLFVGLAIAILATSTQSEVGARVGGYIAALLVGGLGADAIVSAARNRLSILARLGPFP